MSLGSQSLLTPFVGKSSILLVESRQANLAVARWLLSSTDTSCSILDIDALYSSAADSIMKGLPQGRLQEVQIIMPRPGSDIESPIGVFFGSDSRLMIIDSLNSLNHILSLDNRKSRSRKLSFLISGLSYLARTASRSVIFTMYRRERPRRAAGGLPITELSDVLVSAKLEGGELRLNCDRGYVWPGGGVSIRFP